MRYLYPRLPARFGLHLPPPVPPLHFPPVAQTLLPPLPAMAHHLRTLLPPLPAMAHHLRLNHQQNISIILTKERKKVKLQKEMLYEDQRNVILQT